MKASGLTIARSCTAFLDRPLIWLLPFYLAGLSQGWRGEPAEAEFWLILALAASILLGLIRQFFQPKAGFVIFLAVPAFCLGWGLGAKSLARPEDPRHLVKVLESLGEKPVILGGRAAEGSGGRGGGYYRLMVDAEEIILPGPAGPLARMEVFGRVRLGVGGLDGPDDGQAPAALEIEAGDYLRLPVVLRPISGFRNPGLADYEKYWAGQGVLVGGFVKSPALITSWPGPRRGLGAWRSRAEMFIREKTPPSASGILAAQLLGRRGAVDGSGEEIFRALGLSHLLAVSGLHLGVCYGLAFWLLRAGLRGAAKLRRGAAEGGGRLKVNVLAAVLALGPTLLYAAVVGTASPVVRALVTLCAVVLAGLILRRSDPWNILAAAAWVLLLLEPQRLFTASFQLSFVATAAMLAVFVRRSGAEPEARARASGIWTRPVNAGLLIFIWKSLKDKRRAAAEERPWPRPGESFFKKALLAALAGSLGTAPLVAWHFTWLPLAGIPANLLFTPLISLFVLMPGLLGLALLPLSPALAAWPLELAGVVLTALMPVMEKLAEAAGPGVPLPAPSPWFLAAYYLAGWILLRHPAPRKKRLAAAALALLAGLAPGLLSGQGERGLLRLTVLDVGQGAAVHLNLPDGRQMLVDGGGTARFDPGERIITPYMSHQGLRRLDVAILTHPDLDHLKGLVYIAKHYRPREIWDAPWPRDYSALYRDFLKASPASRRPPLDELRAGRRFGAAEVRLLWPPPGHDWPESSPKASWGNDSGLVVRIGWGRVSFLITGDISKKVERELIAAHGRALGSTVLLAPHHGSRDSLSPEFLAAVAPEYVVFSSGRNNYLNLPHPETIRRVEDFGAIIWRTDLSGAAVFEAREKDGEVEVELIRWRERDF